MQYLGGGQNSMRSCSKAVRDGLREGWNKINCFQTDLGTPMRINNNNNIQALKNEEGSLLYGIGGKTEKWSLQEQVNFVGILMLYYP